MVTVEKKQINGRNVYYLKGVIDETTNFNALLGTLPPEVEFNCRQVSKINSNGVKSWIVHFSAVAKSGVKFSFVEMSIPLVEQLNSLANFPCTAPVISIESPYLCTNPKCKKEVKVILQTSTIDPQAEVEPVKCPHCGGSAEFDDLPDEYFAFKESA